MNKYQESYKWIHDYFDGNECEEDIAAFKNLKELVDSTKETSIYEKALDKAIERIFSLQETIDSMIEPDEELSSEEKEASVFSNRFRRDMYKEKLLDESRAKANL